jgi:hypothetical protein
VSNPTHSTKQKITVTLGQDEADLLVQAVRIASRRRGDGDGDEPDSQNRRWMLGWAIAAVSRAIIRAGSMPCPLGVELRPEISAAAKEPITGGTILPASPQGGLHSSRWQITGWN